MSWYYAQDGQQRGPVSDAEFDELTKAGMIQADTLVWREGMPDWQPYAQASAAPAAETAAPPVVRELDPGMQVCSRCGQTFSTQDLLQYDQAWVCANCKPLFFQELRERGESPAALEYGGFWIRLGAKFVDGFILMLPVCAVLFGVIMYFRVGRSSRDPFGTSPLAIQLLFQVGFYGLSALYHIFFVGHFGATPGKMAAGLRIVQADGSPVGYGRATGRFFAELISGLLCYLGYLMIAFDKEKRGLHDLICNTRVIKKPRS